MVHCHFILGDGLSLGQAAPGRLWGVLDWRRDGGACWDEEASRPGDPLLTPGAGAQGRGVSPFCSRPRRQPSAPGPLGTRSLLPPCRAGFGLPPPRRKQR